MTGELAFIVEQKDEALVVPSQALQEGRVWRVEGDRAQPVEVRVGLKSIERIEIISGLAAGERIIISPTQDLTPGQRVRTEFMDPAAAAGLNKKPEEQKVQGGIEKL
jgi:hypothetical protein